MKLSLNVEAILSAVREAAEITESREKATRVNVKGDRDFVTAADKGVQEYLRPRLAAILPEADFFSEEDDDRTSSDGLRWILDPVDGTTNLMHDLPQYAVSLALAEGDQPIFGAIYSPRTDDLYYAIRGEGAYKAHRGATDRLCVSGVIHPKDALTLIGTSPYHKDLVDANFKLFRVIFDHTQDIRRFGAASLDCCFIAASYADIFVERRLQPWDYAAGMLIVTEAGGRMTDLDGNQPSLYRPSDILATNGHLHDEILNLIRNSLE